MDNGKFSDLSSLLSTLSQNPAALSALGSIMESINKKNISPDPPKTENFDAGKLLGLLGAVNSSRENTSGKSSFSPFGSKEDVKNRIALLNAINPFLSEKRRQILDLIIKLLKLSELGELGKLFNALN